MVQILREPCLRCYYVVLLMGQNQALQSILSAMCSRSSDELELVRVKDWTAAVLPLINHDGLALTYVLATTKHPPYACMITKVSLKFSLYIMIPNACIRLLLMVSGASGHAPIYCFTQNTGEQFRHFSLTRHESVARPLPPCNICLSLSKQARLLDCEVPLRNILLISLI